MNIHETAAVVSGWTKIEAQKGKMLPKNPEDVVTEIKNGQSVILPDSEGNPVAYCRLLSWKNDNFVEIGSLVVEENHRKQGFGTEAILETVDLAKELFPKAKIFALTENPQSMALFTKVGGIKMSKQELPEEVWNLCHETDKTCEQWGIFPRCFCVPFSLTHLSKEVKNESHGCYR